MRTSNELETRSSAASILRPPLPPAADLGGFRTVAGATHGTVRERPASENRQMSRCSPELIGGRLTTTQGPNKLEASSWMEAGPWIRQNSVGRCLRCRNWPSTSRRAMPRAASLTVFSASGRYGTAPLQHRCRRLCLDRSLTGLDDRADERLIFPTVHRATPRARGKRRQCRS